MSSRIGDQVGDEEVKRILDRIYRRLLRASQEEVLERRRLRRVSSVEEFRKAVKSGRPVVVVFTSPMCPGCQMYKPMVEEAARRLEDVEFIEVDAYELPELAWEYGVTGLPATVIFVGGEPVDGFMGAVDADTLAWYVRRAVRRGTLDHVHRVGEEEA